MANLSWCNVFDTSSDVVELRKKEHSVQDNLTWLKNKRNKLIMLLHPDKGGNNSLAAIVNHSYLQGKVFFKATNNIAIEDEFEGRDVVEDDELTLLVYEELKKRLELFCLIDLVYDDTKPSYRILVMEFEIDEDTVAEDRYVRQFYNGRNKFDKCALVHRVASASYERVFYILLFVSPVSHSQVVYLLTNASIKLRAILRGRGELDDNWWLNLQRFEVFHSAAASRLSTDLHYMSAAHFFYEEANIETFQELQVFCDLLKSWNVEVLDEKYNHISKKTMLKYKAKIDSLESPGYLKHVYQHIEVLSTQYKQSKSVAEYVEEFLLEHIACCKGQLPKLDFLAERAPSTFYPMSRALIDWLFEPVKGKRVLMLNSKDKNYGKTYFCRALLSIFPDNATFGLTLEASSFTTSHVLDKKVLFNDDISSCQIDTLKQNKSHLDGIVPSQLNTKYGNIDRAIVPPLLLTSNLTSDDQVYDDLRERITFVEFKYPAQSRVTSLEELPHEIAKHLFQNNPFICRDCSKLLSKDVHDDCDML